MAKSLLVASRARAQSAKRIALLVAAFFCIAHENPAIGANTTTDTWKGTTDVNWATTTNWSLNSAPGGARVAEFGGTSPTFTNQPKIAATQLSLGGIWLTDNLAQDVTITGTSGSTSILLGATPATINGISNVGILLDDSANHNLTLGAFAPIKLGASTSFIVNNAGTLTISSTFIQPSTGGGNMKLTLGGNNSAGKINISAALQDNGVSALSVTQSGLGTTTLTGASTFTGVLTLNAGILNTATAGINGSSTTNGIVFGGGTLQAGGTLSTGKAVSMTGAGTVDTHGNVVTLSGNITGSGGALTKTGASTLLLSGSANTFSGGLVINQGTVQDTNANSGVLGSGNVTFGAVNTPTLDLNGHNATVGLLAGSGTNGVVTNSLTSSTSVLSLSGTGSQSFGGVIQNGGLGKVVALTLGTGTQTFTNANTYTGATTVNGGTLRLSNTAGSATGNGNLTVNAGATLAGSGRSAGSSFSLTGSSTTRANVLVGHDSTGDLTTIGAMDLEGSGANTIAAANLEFNLNAAGQTNQLNVVNSNITFNTVSGLNTTLTINVQGAAPIANGTVFTLITGSNTTTIGVGGLTGGQYANLQTMVVNGQTRILTGTMYNLQLDFNNQAYDNSYLYLVQSPTGIDNIVLKIEGENEAVPEPSTWAMMLMGFGLLILWQRRQCKLC